MAYVGRPSLTRSPAARGAGSHWGARLPLLTPDGGMRGGETGPGAQPQAHVVRRADTLKISNACKYFTVGYFQVVLAVKF